MSSSVIDPASDVSRAELARLVKLYDLPDFVKRADLNDTIAVKGPATTYADPFNSRFCCKSAAATWLSGLYFQEKQAAYPPKDREFVKDRIEQFVDYFNIRGPYNEMVKRAAELKAGSELPDSAYAYVWKDETGRKDRHLPMRSAMETKAAADWLLEHRDALPFDDRHTIANKIMTKAAEYGANISPELTDFLEKQAGYGIGSPTEIIEQIMHRAYLAQTDEYKQQIVKLAAAVENNPQQACMPDNLLKLASTMDATDRALGIKEYGQIIQRPEEFLFSVTLTKAAADQSKLVATTTGNVYTLDQLEKLSRENIEQVGSDLADEVCIGNCVDVEKFAQIIPTLPTPEMELFDTMMRECGQLPAMQKAASESYGLTDEQLDALAVAYETSSI